MTAISILTPSGITRPVLLLYIWLLYSPMLLAQQKVQYLPALQGKMYGIKSRSGKWVLKPEYDLINWQYMDDKYETFFAAYKGDTSWMIEIENDSAKRSIPFCNVTLTSLSKYYISVFRKDSGHRVYHLPTGFITRFYSGRFKPITDSVFYTTCQVKDYRLGEYDVDTLINYKGKRIGISHQFYYTVNRSGQTNTGYYEPIYKPAANGLIVVALPEKRGGQVHFHYVTGYNIGIYNTELAQLTPFVDQGEIWSEPAKVQMPEDSLKWVKQVLLSTSEQCTAKDWPKDPFERAYMVNEGWSNSKFPCANYADNYPALKELSSRFTIGPVINNTAVAWHKQSTRGEYLVLDIQGDTIIHTAASIRRNAFSFFADEWPVYKLYNLEGKLVTTYGLIDSVYRITGSTDTLSYWTTDELVSDQSILMQVTFRNMATQKTNVLTLMLDPKSLNLLMYKLVEEKENTRARSLFEDISTNLVNDSILTDFASERPSIYNLKSGTVQYLTKPIYWKPRKVNSYVLGNGYIIDRGLLMNINGKVVDKRHLYACASCHPEPAPIAGKYMFVYRAPYRTTNQLDPAFYNRYMILDTSSGKLIRLKKKVEHLSYDEEGDYFGFSIGRNRFYLFPDEVQGTLF